MKRIKDKRRKQRQGTKEKQNQFLLWNGTDIKIHFHKIVKAFPDIVDRQNYIKALVEGL